MENNTSVAQQIKAAIAAVYPDHKKFDFAHTDACNGELGLEILIISDKFEGVKLLDRHRQVQGIIEPYGSHVHKMTIKTYTVKQGQTKGLL